MAENLKGISCSLYPTRLHTLEKRRRLYREESDNIRHSDRIPLLLQKGEKVVALGPEEIVTNA